MLVSLERGQTVSPLLLHQLCSVDMSLQRLFTATGTGLESMAAPFCNAAVLSSLVADMSNATLGALRRACSDVMAVRVQITEAGQWRISFGEV